MLRRNLWAAAAAGLPTRKTGKVEIVFPSPGPQPNGLQAVPEGLWVIDQGAGSRVTLIDFQGKVRRSFETETERSSGITYDGEALWIASTYSRETVRVHATTGRTLERRFTPGAGVIYKRKGDPAARASPVPSHLRQKPPAAPAQQGGSRIDAADTKWPGTGGHGLEWRAGKLWSAVPPSRHIYCIDPQTWTVETMFPTAGNRVHGIGWEGPHLWAADSNHNAFFRHDVTTGALRERIQLADTDPVPHGMTIWNGWLWYCDDIGLICRLKLR